MTEMSPSSIKSGDSGQSTSSCASSAGTRKALMKLGDSARTANACKSCNKTVYPFDPQLNLGQHKYHKTCAKCEDCHCQLTLSNYTSAPDGSSLLCSLHMKIRFRQEGQYRGGGKYKVFK